MIFDLEIRGRSYSERKWNGFVSCGFGYLQISAKCGAPRYLHIASDYLKRRETVWTEENRGKPPSPHAVFLILECWQTATGFRTSRLEGSGRTGVESAMSEPDAPMPALLQSTIVVWGGCFGNSNFCREIDVSAWQMRFFLSSNREFSVCLRFVSAFGCPSPPQVRCPIRVVRFANRGLSKSHHKKFWATWWRSDVAT